MASLEETFISQRRKAQLRAPAGSLFLVAAIGLSGCAEGPPPGYFDFEDAAAPGPSTRDAATDAAVPSPRDAGEHDDPDAAPLLGSCAGRCGSTGAVDGCFCDPACASHGDCCADHATACAALDGGADAAPSPPLLCAGRCGAVAPAGGCGCDATCATTGTCCSDYATACAPPDAGPHAGSCVAQCGVKGPAGQCHCDSSCTSYGDCCPDYGAACGDAGGP